MRFIICLFSFCCVSGGWAQIQKEVNPPSHIKTIIFKGSTDDQFPVIRLKESMTLVFDDLTASEQDYYYKIVHCNYDWTPSQLLKSQYLVGVDNQRIIQYENSYNTLQPYSNYRLTIPNAEVRLKVGGNYMLEIYNRVGVLQLSRRFVVYEDLVSVSAVVRRSRDFNFLNEKQSVQFTVNTLAFPVVNPQTEIKIAIVQNYFWPTALYNIKPQFITGTKLTYRYDRETSFFGGNEFLNFDTKDLRVPTVAISHIALDEVYHHYLFPSAYRFGQSYTFFPDINGDFVLSTFQGADVAREAEYSKVHFSLPYTDFIGLDKVYVVGRFNNYTLSAENRMRLNPESGFLELPLLIKQGFYNYKYVVERQDGTVDFNAVSGNYHFTENHYLILVYYRDFGALFDRIIGIGSVNSATISN